MGLAVRLLVALTGLLTIAVPSPGTEAAARRCAEAGDAARLAEVRAAAEARCDCGGARDHRKYLHCIAELASDAVRRGELPADCRIPLLRCEATSLCGRPSAVVCCRNRCRIKPRKACKATGDADVCPVFGPSCCDVCGAPGCRTRSPTTTLPGSVAHFEYVFPDGGFFVYDMDHDHVLLKTVTLPQAHGIRGVVANAPTHALYVSYGGDGDGRHGAPTLLRYDLLSDAVVWTHTYAIGIDSMAITPDGSRIYMPTGELAAAGTWYVIAAETGDIVGTIAGPRGPHNTVVGTDGARAYLGGRGENALTVVDTATNRVVQRVAPLLSSVRPFTINGRETIAYVAITGLRGFQIGDLATGAALRTVTFSGASVSRHNGPSAPSHGISLSPDERELYVVDWPDYVHVFDVSGVPGAAPEQVADIPLTPNMNRSESPCLYDCLTDGWLQHSRDGRFVYVGDQGDVIYTTTRRVVANLPTLANTRKMIEIDWAGGVPVYAANSRASVGFVR